MPDAASGRELGVFEQMSAVKERLAAIRSDAERVIVFPVTRDDALWLVQRIEAVLAAVTDAQVTYGIIDTAKETTSPMFTERDAIARALYTGGHPEVVAASVCPSRLARLCDWLHLKRELRWHRRNARRA